MYIMIASSMIDKQTATRRAQQHAKQNFEGCYCLAVKSVHSVKFIGVDFLEFSRQ